MSSERVLCVFAHPDDEVLACGGTIAKHVEVGDEVQVLILADGVGSRKEQDLKERQIAGKRANMILGTRNLTLLEYADNKMDTYPQLQITQSIEDVMEGYKPTVVYTHWHGDMNIDHQVVSKSVKVACRPQTGSTVKLLLMGEVCSSTEWAGGFNPTWFVNICSTWNKKIDALMCYKKELRDWPHARSLGAVKALMQHRGASVGVGYAEAFELVRSIA